jgi:hypothetical protein
MSQEIKMYDFSSKCHFHKIREKYRAEFSLAEAKEK